MKVYFTRHGQTEWNVEGKLQGWNNSNLTKEGIESAKKLSERLKDIDFDYIFSSTQQRALDTANLIRGEKNTEILAYDELREIGFGDWEGMEIEKIKEIYSEDFDTYLNRPHLHNPVSGETFYEVYKRIQKMLDIILETKADNVLVVSHGVTIKILTSIIKGIPIEQLYKLDVQRGTALNICEYDGNNLKFILEGDTTHL